MTHGCEQTNMAEYPKEGYDMKRTVRVTFLARCIILE
jgi:hypothetical protein